MSAKKRDLEIVYNLLWKNRPLNADDRSNVVGMYDVPSTTLNWESFKSYLMKNSGSTCSDIKVSYIDVDDKEIVIESQADFQLAMYSFRKRARIGDIITLKLDKVGDQRKKESSKRMYWSDVHEQAVMAEEPNLNTESQPPEWFLKYMKKFKKEMLDEVTVTITKATQKISNSSQHSTRKVKADSHKKIRKLPVPIQSSALNPDRRSYEELRKLAKFENKLECKLEKLEQKSMKIKAKKMILKVSSDSDAGRSSSHSRLIGLAPSETELLMNAHPVESHETTVPHMFGGETYLQSWKVLNSGKFSWSDETELRFAWGSERLIPVMKRVTCPPLKPGEQGLVTVFLEIPETPGQYECYWHFYHVGRRFGHWLGCQVIVDEQPIKKISPKKPKLSELDLDVGASFLSERTLPQKRSATNALESESPKEDINTDAINEKLQELNLQNVQSNDVTTSAALPNIKSENKLNSSDSDNISILSLSGNSSDTSCCNEGGYIFITNQDVVKNEESNSSTIRESSNVQEEINVENVAKEMEVTTVENNNFDNKEEPVKEQNNEENKVSETTIEDISDYAYIYYKGEKYPFHKKFLSDEYFSKAEKVNDSQTPSPPNTSMKQEESALTKSQSSDGSSTRLFVFPQSSPGFEVVYPTLDEIDGDKMKDTNDFFSVTTEELEQKDVDVETVSVNESKSISVEDSGMCGSINSIYNNASSQSEYQCNVTQAQTNSIYFDQVNYSCNYGGCENQCWVSNVPQIHCPYMVNEHFIAGCNSQTCNMTYPNPPPRVMSSSSSSHTLYENVPSTKAETVTSATYSSPQMSDSVQSSCEQRPHLHRPKIQPNRPDNLITGAAILASSAMSTARSMMNMVIQNGGGKWVNGHWVVENPNTKRENGLRLLAEMGFVNRDLNATLMARFNDDVHRVISELVQ